MFTKIFLFLWTCLLTLSTQTHAASIRYFMQPANVAGSITPYGINDKAAYYVQADDVKLYYEVYGSGKPVFVFHGGLVGSPYELGQCIDALRKDFQVIVVSTRGHGRSEIGHKSLTYTQKAQDMLAVMRAITQKPAAVLGFSDGAYAAYKLASLYPEAVERIIAIGAGTLKPGYFPANLQVTDLEHMDQAYVQQMQHIMPEPARLQEFLSNYMNFWHNLSVEPKLFASIKCPTLLIAGDEDDHAPIMTVLEAHQALPNSRLCIVPKAGHTAFLDNWPVTWACINSFIHADLLELTSSKKLEYNNIK